ncbi:MAG: S9 family peptidase [Bacteroidetes bacterium]|nr:S9 family peptidase [Bacteroidota bacterium]
MLKKTNSIIFLLLMISSLFVGSSIFAAERDSIFNDLYQIKKPSNGKLSLNGNQFIYTLSSVDKVKKKYLSDLFLVDFSTKKTVMSVSANSETSYNSISWLDKNKIAFMSNKGLGTQVYNLEIGGKQTQVTENPTSIQQYQFNLEKKIVYFIAEDTTSAREKLDGVENCNSYYFEENRKHSSLYEYDPEKKLRKKLTFGITVKSFIYSPDKQLIAFTATSKPYSSFEQSTEIYLLDLATRGVKRLTNNSIIEKQLQRGNKGNSILFVSACSSDLQPYYQESIFRIDLKENQVVDILPDFGYQVVSYIQNKDKNKIFFIANLGVTQQLFCFDIERKTYLQLTTFKGVVKEIIANGEKLVMLYSDPKTPDDYYISDINKISFTRITDSNNDMDMSKQPVYHVQEWRSKDGTKVSGVLIVPAKYDRKRKYPLVVQLHEGPNSSCQMDFSNSWVTYPKILTDRGYMVFQPNYRGSAGFGDKFMRGIIGDFFAKATEDILSGTEYLIENGIADESMLAIMGYSAGAHFTNWIITQTDIFKVAISHAGLANWLSFYAQTEVPYLREIWLDGLPYENTDFLLESSPVTYISSVKTPTLFICGETDKRVPYTQNLEMYRGLMRYNIPSRFLIIPNEGHVLTDVKTQIYKISQELEWMDKYFK